MRWVIRVLMWLIAVTLFGGVATAGADERIAFEPFEIETYGGRKVAAEIGSVDVPENRSKSSSQTIKLAVARLKCTAAEPGPPVVYLAGGPGGSAIAAARMPYYLRMFQRLQEHHDVILMDQRGTGRSTPNVRWISFASLPQDVFLSHEKATEALRQWSQKAVEAFGKRGIDLTGYNTVESADDINDLRVALGAEKISLLGFSYGTHLGLATVRRHGERLDSVVLVGTEGPNHNYKLPSTYDSQLRKISDLVARDPEIGSALPDMVALLRRVLARLESEPAVVTVRDPWSSRMVEIPIGKFGLQLILRMDIGDGNDIPNIPLLLASIDRGDYTMLAGYAEKRYRQFGRGMSGMSVMMDLYSGATATRQRRIEEETPDCILGPAVNFLLGEIADIWGNPDLGDEYRRPIHSNIRTLFVSGTLDSNTPPFQAEEIRWGFSNAEHIVVANAGHEDMLPDPEVQSAIARFLDGQDVSDVRIALPPPEFRAIR